MRTDYAQYLKMARATKDERTHAILSRMAQVWFRLAEEKAKNGNEKTD